MNPGRGDLISAAAGSPSSELSRSRESGDPPPTPPDMHRSASQSGLQPPRAPAAPDVRGAFAQHLARIWQDAVPSRKKNFSRRLVGGAPKTKCFWRAFLLVDQESFAVESRVISTASGASYLLLDAVLRSSQKQAPHRPAFGALYAQPRSICRFSRWLHHFITTAFHAKPSRLHRKLVPKFLHVVLT
jgi:hypothetical protein